MHLVTLRASKILTSKRERGSSRTRSEWNGSRILRSAFSWASKRSCWSFVEIRSFSRGHCPWKRGRFVLGGSVLQTPVSSSSGTSSARVLWGRRRITWSRHSTTLLFIISKIPNTWERLITIPVFCSTGWPSPELAAAISESWAPSWETLLGSLLAKFLLENLARFCFGLLLSSALTTDSGNGPAGIDSPPVPVSVSVVSDWYAWPSTFLAHTFGLCRLGRLLARFFTQTRPSLFLLYFLL